ncbi:hypothetical protein QBC44DRAFT_374338 [Cladorrhinum sp. PSN332]|nr:hypothetical protein QBC44DRAFT_374338 [Cladorrhinum sp. PSN332]
MAAEPRPDILSLADGHRCVNNVRITAAEILDCLRSNSQTLQTLAIQGRMKDSWSHFAPPLTPIQGFPNLRSLAVQFENLDFHSTTEGSEFCLSNLVRDCQKLEHLFLFGVKDLRKCEFGLFASAVMRCEFLRLKQITLMAHEDEDPDNDWVARVQEQMVDTQTGEQWTAMLASMGVKVVVLPASKSLWDEPFEDENVPGPGWHLKGHEEKLLRQIENREREIKQYLKRGQRRVAASRRWIPPWRAS